MIQYDFGFRAIDITRHYSYVFLPLQCLVLNVSSKMLIIYEKRPKIMLSLTDLQAPALFQRTFKKRTLKIF